MHAGFLVSGSEGAESEGAMGACCYVIIPRERRRAGEQDDSRRLQQQRKQALRALGSGILKVVRFVHNDDFKRMSLQNLH